MVDSVVFDRSKPEPALYKCKLEFDHIENVTPFESGVCKIQEGTEEDLSADVLHAVRNLPKEAVKSIGSASNSFGESIMKDCRKGARSHRRATTSSNAHLSWALSPRLSACSVPPSNFCRIFAVE